MYYVLVCMYQLVCTYAYPLVYAYIYNIYIHVYIHAMYIAKQSKGLLSRLTPNHINPSVLSWSSFPHVLGIPIRGRHYKESFLIMTLGTQPCGDKPRSPIQTSVVWHVVVVPHQSSSHIHNFFSYTNLRALRPSASTPTFRSWQTLPIASCLTATILGSVSWHRSLTYDTVWMNGVLASLVDDNVLRDVVVEASARETRRCGLRFNMCRGRTAKHPLLHTRRRPQAAF